MLRYLKVTFLLGLLVAIVVAALYYFGVLRGLDSQLQGFLGLPTDGLARPPYQYGVIALLAVGVMWTTIDINRWVLKTVVAVAVVLQVISMVYVASLFGEFFSPIPGALATVGAFIVGFMYARSEGGNRKRVLEQVFGKRISRKMIKKMIASEYSSVAFKGELQEGSVLQCHVFNHEELMAELTPEDYVSMVNLWLATASKFLVEHGAYIDECDGESLRAVFGAPVASKTHAEDACRTALDLDKRLRNLNLECDSYWHRTLDYRIGLDSGPMITGAYGSEVLGGFSCAGDTVDLASSLCRANILYSTRILIGPGTFEAVQENIVVRPIDLVPLASQEMHVEVYEPLGETATMTEKELDMRQQFWEGVVFFREQLYAEAGERFQTVLDANPDDGSAQFYMTRIHGLREGGADPASERLKSFGIL